MTDQVAAWLYFLFSNITQNSASLFINTWIKRNRRSTWILCEPAADDPWPTEIENVAQHFQDVATFAEPSVNVVHPSVDCADVFHVKQPLEVVHDATQRGRLQDTRGTRLLQGDRS